MNKAFLIIALVCIGIVARAQQYNLPQQQDRWKIQPDESIEWKIDDRLPHSDHIEMSGQKISLWIQYEVDTSGALSLNRAFVFPTFRLLPVRTGASMMYNITDQDLPHFIINDRLLKAGVYNASVMTDQPEKVISIRHKGITEINSTIGRDRSITLKRVLFPSTDKPIAIERCTFINNGKQPAKIEMEYMRRDIRPAADRSTPVQHHFVVST